MEAKAYMNGDTPRPGIYVGIPEEEYNQIPALRSTTIKLAKRSLLDVKVVLNRSIERKETNALTVGDACHAAVLEPERYVEQYTDRPQKPEGEGWLDGTEEIKEAIRRYNLELDQPREIAGLSRIPPEGETSGLNMVYQWIDNQFKTLGDRWMRQPISKSIDKDEKIRLLKEAEVEVPETVTIKDLDKLITTYNKTAATDKEVKDCIEAHNKNLRAQMLPLSGTRDELTEILRAVKPDAKFWHEEFAQLTEGKTILSEWDWHLTQRLEMNARAHPVISKMLVGGLAEVTVIWQDPETELWLKARLDYAVGLEDRDVPILLDLKTSAHPINNNFQVARTIEKYSYDFSAAMYSAGVEAVTGKLSRWAWIFAEKDGANQLRAFQASNKMMAKGDAEFRECLRAIKKAMDTDHWPGYPDEIELIDPLEKNVSF